MKVKLRKHVTSSYTIASPYLDEIGSHRMESVKAYCGNCGRSVEQAHFYHSWNYCPYCGKKIDWPEDEPDRQ